MLIGQLADAAGVTAQTIRFYERDGLLPRPPREANGYRVYGGDTLGRLRFIRSAQASGLTLAEIRGIVDLRDAGTVPCTHVTTLLAARLDEVHARVRELEALAGELERLLTRGDRLDPADCGDAAVCHILVGDS
ncbi:MULTISPECIES: heavy metal-responsive transcriptional regulator [unclassified Nocardioides]|uniref:heavy metal-responsive transcriptional regulator n=1 Tax=unclassified Nocardioides TaxID=2615069 RepID=UPI0000574C57|nr:MULTISPECIES: heavy metal-responsive transcriptional regulator [unclassified Nocardioides]ABL81159.1 transcriptional regulator, MerR family [Nocardioides sp. JS614]